jgi:hypothetical protein
MIEEEIGGATWMARDEETVMHRDLNSRDRCLFDLFAALGILPALRVSLDSCLIFTGHTSKMPHLD